MKKKSIKPKSFKTTKAMDDYLEATDLGSVFKKSGIVEQSKIKKINIDLPDWLLNELDYEAKRAGVSRQPLIKIWLIQKLEEERKRRQ